jgi:hypothetical protein
LLIAPAGCPRERRPDDPGLRWVPPASPSHSTMRLRGWRRPEI